MLDGGNDANLYSDWYDYIADDQTKDAYSYIIGMAASLRSCRVYPMSKGAVRDVRFKAGDKMPFAFIVNKSSLLFYFRQHAVESGRYAYDRLEVMFDDVKKNTEGEWTVRLRSIADVKRLWPFLALS